MPGLLLIITTGEGERFAAASELAATMAAMARPVAILLRGSAVAAIAQGANAADLANWQELGVEVFACQTAMAEAAVTAAQLPPMVQPSGLVTVLHGRADWQITIA